MNILAREEQIYFQSDDFYNEVKRRIQNEENSGKTYYIATLDLDHFNYINDLFGYETGDLVLQKLIQHFSKVLKGKHIFCKLHADIFSLCLQHEEYGDIAKYFSELTNWQDALYGILPEHYSLTASGGIVAIVDTNVPVSSLIDKANYARLKAKGKMYNSFLVYDEKMSEELHWQKVVTFSMEAALENHEFEMFLQPKVYMKNGQIVGSEALVRWRSPIYGLIPPDRFIPILEQNGFVRQLDFYMLKEACRFLEKSAEYGLPQIPISVNFSKTHLTQEHLVEQIFQTVNQMGINTKFIEIEFTESLSVEGFERLIEVVSDLKLLGFNVSLDDFGSAYSSLNCLKELPIDIIKIDKGFLNSSSNTEKGKMIIAKVVELIKSMRMICVMEGVETAEQVDFLNKMSCDLGQGYYFAKPMPTSEFIAYLKEGNLLVDVQAFINGQGELNDTSFTHAIPQEFQMDNWELYTLGKNIDMGLMKGYLDRDASIQYINDRALEYLGCTRHEFREIFHNNIVAFMHPDDVATVNKNVQELLRTGKAYKFQTRAIRKDGKIIYLQGRSSCVIDDHGRPVGLYAFQDVTEELEMTNNLQRSLEEKIQELEASVEAEKQSKEALRISEERYRMIVEQSDDIMFDWDFETDTIFLSDKYIKLFGQIPIMENLRTNQGIRERIYPEDLAEFENWIKKAYRKAGHFISEFRCRGADGKYIWLRGHSTAACDEEGNALRAVGLFANINSQKIAFDALTIKSQRDPLTKLLNKEETMIQVNALLEEEPNVPGAFFMIDIDDFKGLNDNLGHQCGDEVLMKFSKTIQNFFLEDAIVGRIGGDEFSVYLRDIHPENLNRKIDSLIKDLRLNYEENNTKISLHGSVGVSCYPLHGKSFKELYQFADIALYVSKRGGKGRGSIYQTDMADPMQNNCFYNDLPYQIFEMLYNTKDIEVSVQMILELLGTYFGVEHVYIFQNDASNEFAKNTYEWRLADIPETGSTPQSVHYKALGDYLSQYSSDGVYCCSDIREASLEVYEICVKQKIKSLLHCAIYNEQVMIGFIGFDMCSEYHKWKKEEISILSYLSKILSVFLLKSNGN